MKENQLLNASRLDFVLSLPQLADVRITDWATDKTTKLQKSESDRIWHSDFFSLDGRKHPARELLTTMRFHHTIPAERLSVFFRVILGHEL